jgi:molybdopterin/thiamine biosynthesis adenylyltransferase
MTARDVMTFPACTDGPPLEKQEACPPFLRNAMGAAEPSGHELPRSDPPPWSYDEAFARNLGLIARDEQRRLRDARVAIAGMGGVGGVHLMTLARLGIGRFTIADSDTFQTANFNRQYGATLRNLGRSKATAMAQEVRQVNPDVDLRVIPEFISEANIGDFLDGASVVLDGVDFFALDARRLLFQEARKRGIWAMTAGPVGFSAAWLIFDPQGVSFDTYFDMRDDMRFIDKAAAFAIGLSPAGTHWGYYDLSEVDMKSQRAPSVGLACQICSGITAAETAKIILGRKGIRPVPCYAQFDAYRGILRRGRLLWGNRGPLQRLKRALIRRKMVQFGYQD